MQSEYDATGLSLEILLSNNYYTMNQRPITLSKLHMSKGHFIVPPYRI